MKSHSLPLKVLPSCPDCRERTQISEWRPPQGTDPHLREFICPRCGSVFYKKADPRLLAFLNQTNSRSMEGL